jgi:dihydropteroate synthase
MKRILSLPGKRNLILGDRPLVMGIVNLTPDSFFPDSRVPGPALAVERALKLLEEGANILDFGAESTRPGSAAVGPEEEIKRLIPALRAFRARSGAVVSVDTRRAEVAKAALDEGADIVNDIAALSDPGMATLVARSGAGLVLMHMLGEPQTMQENPVYGDCAVEVAAYLCAAAAKALDAGVSKDSIILDPGIGFGKTLEHNLDLIKRLYLVAECGYPVLVGLSRKRFIGEISGKPVEQRLAGSLGAACAAWLGGADIIRVHDVEETKDALALFRACAPVQAYPDRAMRM